MAALVYGCTSSNVTGDVANDNGNAKAHATVFKDSSCGCCGVYSQYLGKMGYDIEVVESRDMGTVKKEYGVPYTMQSCHTTAIRDYFVEGHVPVEAIEKLMAEKPDIAGIVLPGMPSGSPGMGGSRSGQFVIYAIGKDGTTTEFMRI